MLSTRNIFLPIVLLSVLLTSAGCFHYSLKEGSIPKEIKTIRINFIENKARYINPQLSPQLTDRLRQKINNQTRLTQIQGDNADYDISGFVKDYSFTTAGVAATRAATTRLTITVEVHLLNRLDDKMSKKEDVTSNFDFDANITIQQAEAQLNESILRNLTDAIFNQLFSNW